MNKKGAFSVYACLFLSVLFMAAGIFITAAKKDAAFGTARACSRLWSASVLAEYDLNLQQRYHLFGYYGYPALVLDKLAFYSGETFGDKNDGQVEILSCSLYEHSLRNTEILRKQIAAWGKLTVAGNLKAPISNIEGVTHHEKPSRQTLFADLPSAGTKGSISVTELVKQMSYGSPIGNILKKGTDTWFQNAYILTHFKHQTNGQDLGETCLQYETEYIIGGKTSDSENEKVVKGRIIALREAVNFAYLETNLEKTAAIRAAAEAADLVAPGGGTLTSQALMALWAYAESVNDYRLLQAGYPVATIKNDENWAIDLDSVLADDGRAGYVDTGSRKGDTYEDYLSLLLMGMKEEIRLLRIMDLIQMNMRYSYYDSFLISDYYGGISYTYNINGETCHVEESYE